MNRAIVLVVIAGALPAFADGLPDGRGVAAPSGSAFTTEITAGDCDDYVLTGFAGTQLTAAVRVAKHSALVPLIELLPPGGTPVTSGDGLVVSGPARAPVARFALDVTGTWKVRVRGADATTGAYTISVKTTKPSRTSVSVDAPDSNGQYRFSIPGGGRATIGYALHWTGAAPAFNSLFDPRGRLVDGFPGGPSVKSFVLPAGSPLGDYTLVFDAAGQSGRVTLSRTLVPAKGAKARVAKLSATEPVIRFDGIVPLSGGTGTEIRVTADGLLDPKAPRGRPSLALGDVPLAEIQLLADGVTLLGKVPEGLAAGTYDVVATSTSGQPAVRAAAFELVDAPVVESIDPLVGSALGGFDITLTGHGFRSSMGLLFDGVLQPVQASSVDAASVRFPMPAHEAGFVTIGVRDLGSQLDGRLLQPRFEYVTTPAITRVTPAIVPILSNETITLEGAFFFPTDKVFLETTTTGVYDEITATQTTYVDFTHHRFTAPLRPKGQFNVYVEDALGRPNPIRPKLLTVFSLADATAASGLASGPDSWDAATSALADIDGDADLDLVLSRRSDAATASTSSQTRVLKNDGHGVFTDATADVVPAAGDDDWRADRVVAADIDGDGFQDLVLTTNSLTVPPAGRSHTRFLMNEARGGTAANAKDRVFRDRTIDVMAPVRTMKKYGVFGGSNAVYVSDDWRGLDLWIGDLDKATPGRPKILLTHDEVKDDDNPNADVFKSGVYCGNYCLTSPPGDLYAYTFYWGGSRAFVWDKTARGGLGRFRFDPNFFPRRSGPVVPPSGLPGGINIWGCSPHYNSICRATFTPFTGKRLAVGDLDHDGKPDIAVLSDQSVQRRASINAPLTTISSLQVALQGFNSGDGAKVTDITPKFTAFGLDLAGDALAIGATGFPDDNPFGTIAVAKAQPGTGSALKLLRFGVSGGVVSVFDVTAAELPTPGALDAFQASQLQFADIDQDGRSDLVLLAPVAPGGNASDLRLLRNEEVAGQKGVFRRSFDAVTGSLAAPSGQADRTALTIGDVTGDGLLEFVLSRTPEAGPGSGTRIVRMEK